MSGDVVLRAAKRAVGLVDEDAREATPVEAMLAHAFALVAVSEAVSSPAEDPDCDPADAAALVILGAATQLGGRLPERDGLGYPRRLVAYLVGHALRTGIIHSLRAEREHEPRTE